jgi:hypothetical protein
MEIDKLLTTSRTSSKKLPALIKTKSEFVEKESIELSKITLSKKNASDENNEEENLKMNASIQSSIQSKRLSAFNTQNK